MTERNKGVIIGIMAKAISRAQHVNGTVRITVPKLLKKQLKWDDAKILIEIPRKDGSLLVRNFLTERDLEDEDYVNSNEANRQATKD